MREFITIVESAQDAPVLDDALLDAFARATKTKTGLKVFFLSLRNGDIKVDSIIASEKKQGQGTAAMIALCAFADAHKARLILTPGQADDHHGTTSTARLKRFYKRFGFVENSGRRKDFSISATMLREPR